jgi:hypothetical protein
LTQYLYLVNPAQAVEILAGAHGAHHQLPPPGMTAGFDTHGDAGYVAFNPVSWQTAFTVSGPPPEGSVDDWWWSTVGEFVTHLSGIDLASVNRFLASVAGILGQALADVMDLLLMKQGTKGSHMRWLKTTVKGSLGAVEEFQFSVNMGHPGDDPDPTQAEMHDIADSLAAKFVAAIGSADALLGGPSRLSQYAPDVVFRQLGVAKLTITDAPDVDGSGGNLHYEGTTEWVFLNSTTGLAGTSGSKCLPYEVACCVSFHTATPGARGRGRCYLPPLCVDTLNTNGGTFATNQVHAAANVFSDYFTAIVAGTDDIVPVVISQRGLFMTPIEQITVGIIPDSQRRRRWSQLEAPIVTWAA